MNRVQAVVAALLVACGPIPCELPDPTLSPVLVDGRCCVEESGICNVHADCCSSVCVSGVCR